MRKRQTFPTPIQEIALNLIFGVLGESRFNRTAQQYEAIGKKIAETPLKALVADANALLRAIHRRSRDSGRPLPLLCRFKAGDERYVYEEFPQEISYETFRAALKISAFRPAGKKRNRVGCS